MYKLIFKRTAIAYCISLSITNAFAETGVNVTPGNEYTAAEGATYDQGTSVSGGFHVNGGTLNIENNVTIDMANANINSNGRGILVLGNGSKVNGSDNLKVHVNQLQNGIAIYLASFSLNSFAAIDSIVANANESKELDDDVVNMQNSVNAVAANGANAKIDTNHFDITASGNSSAAISSSNGGEVFINNSKVTASGRYSQGVNARLGGSINIASSEIKSTGINSQALSAEGGKITSNNTNVTTLGEKSYAVTIPGEAPNSDQSIITFSNGEILTEGKQSHAVFASTGEINLNNTSITTNGELSRGVNATGDGKVNLEKVNIITNGNNRADGIVVSSELIGNNVTVIANGEESYGAVLIEKGSLSLSNSSLVSKQYAALRFTEQSTLAGASAKLKNTTLHGNNHGISSNHSLGSVDLSSSTVSSDNSSAIKASLSSKLDIQARDNSVIQGIITTDETSILNLTLDKSSTWNTTGNSNLTNLTNSGNVIFNSPDYGHTVTVHGDYIGNNGHILFNGDLDGDDSVTDKLIVKGNTIGTTLVSVNNIGGQGAQTINGIELINVSGDSSGIFEQSGRIVAGAYEYFLNRGEGDNNKNWYLTNQLDEPGEPGIPVIRPEAGSYSNNLFVANQLFNTRLHDRLGETQYTDILTGEKKITSMWLRNVAGHSNVTSGNGQLKTGSNRYVMQLGSDIAQWSNNDVDRYHVGLMAGYGRVSGKTTNNLTGYQAKSHLDGYSLGAYGTYYANQENKTGLYVDTWAQYNWFNNRINGDAQAEEKYDTNGITASVESGYTFLLNETQGSKGNSNRWYVQPKAQLTYLGVTMGKHTEYNGTRIAGDGENGVQTRLGVKLFGLGHASQDNLASREFQPFVETNWIYNSKTTDISMDGEKVSQSGTRNIGEVKVGLEGRLTNYTDVWFNVAQQVGDNSYSDTQGMLGIKMRF